MKKLLTISLAILFSAFLNAQGTLQFDRVIFEEFSQNFDPGGDEQITNSQFVIGANQVAKIVSCRFSRHYGTDGYGELGFITEYAWMELNNTVIFEPGPNGIPRINIFPIWLDAGTYTISLNNRYSDSGTVFILYAQYSIIVFNVIP